MPVSSRSAELVYEPSGLTPLGKTTGAVWGAVHRAPVARCATPRASRPPAARPNCTRTFLNWRKTDICILRGHFYLWEEIMRNPKLLWEHTRRCRVLIRVELVLLGRCSYRRSA
jgi:hypothetical protein